MRLLDKEKILHLKVPQIVMLDAKKSAMLNRTVFELIRRGQFEQACELCRKASVPWKAAILQGTSLFNSRWCFFKRFIHGYPKGLIE